MPGLGASAHAHGADLPAVEVHERAIPITVWEAARLRAQAEAQAALDERAGATSLLRREDYASGANRNLADVLAYAPGVYANARHGDETRLAIRGSGIQRGFLLRGVQIQQDGVPLNHADGSGDFQAIDPLAMSHVEIWRGMSALEYGANALGGAVNFVSPTGRSAPRAALRLQGGAFGSRLAHGAVAASGERADVYLSATRSLLDGWREQSGTRATRIQANVGYRLTPQLDARLYLGRVDSHLQMPGSLTRAAMRADPRQAAPNYVRQNAVNNYTLNRAALQLDWRPRANWQWTTTAYASERERFHAMSMGVLANGFRDTGLHTRLVAGLDNGLLQRRLVLGASLQRMYGDQRNFSNERGVAGRATGASTQSARQSVVFGEYTHGLTPQLALQGGLQVIRTTRDLADRMRPSASYAKTLRGVNPKFGVLYAMDEGQQLYASLGRSFEAPPFGELVVRSDQPLADAQKARTLEIGYRKRLDDTQLEAVVYRTQLRGELLALNDARGVALGIVNAGRTIHQGVELGATFPVGAQGRLRMSYLYNDFRFGADPLYGGNRLAGIAPHVLNAEYRWQPSAALWIAPAVEARAGRTWIDHANTVSTGSFALLHLGAGGQIDARTTWFVQLRNLANRRHVSSTAVQADARGQDGAYYFPGDRRALHVGLNWQID